MTAIGAESVATDATEAVIDGMPTDRPEDIRDEDTGGSTRKDLMGGAKTTSEPKSHWRVTVATKVDGRRNSA